MTDWLRRPIVWLPASLAMLAFLAWRSRPGELGDRLARADPVPLAVAVAFNAVILLAWAARSADLLAATGHRIPGMRLVPMTSFANTVNNITPGSIGELARIYLMRVRHGVPYATGAAVVLVERVVAIAYLAASGVILWIAWVHRVPAAMVVAALLLTAAIPNLVYRLGLRPGKVLGVVPWPSRWHRIRDGLVRADELTARILIDPARAATFTAWTAVVFATTTAQLWLVASALGVALDPVAAWGALGIAVSVGVASLLPFGLGSADVMLATLLSATGTGAAEAGAIVLGFRAVSTLPLGIAGAVSYALLASQLPGGDAAAAATTAAAALADPASEVR